MIRVLGPIQIVTSDGRPIDVPSVTQRRLLAVLALHAPTPVRAERLAELLQLSSSGLRTTVTRLRKALGDEALTSTATGYRLDAPVDASQFCRALSASPGDASSTGRAGRRCALEGALAMWLGPAYEEFASEEWAAGEATRLTELHAAATEDLAEELIELQRWSEATAALSEHVAQHPFRDRPRGLLLRALAGAGRQSDALRAYQDYRAFLSEEVGTEPSPQVRRIEQRIAGGWTGTDGAVPSAPTLAPAAGAFPFPAALTAARQGPFVGRCDVVAELRDSWGHQRWRALLLAGEPGIGKTRLLAELAHDLHETGRAVVVGRCDEELVLRYRPWSELLEPLVSALGAAEVAALGPDHLSELGRIVPSAARHRSGPPAPFGGDADARHAVLVDAVVALLRVVGPVVLVLDDIHWIDPPSLQVLRHVLVAAIPDVTVLGAFRDTDVDRHDPLAAVLADLRRVEGVRRLGVDGIDDDAVVALVEGSTGQVLAAGELPLAHAIRARTAGNPLFVGELIRHLSDGAARAHPHEVPDGLVELIARRVARLGDDAVATLRVAAAVGQRFDVALVEDTMALDLARRGRASGTATDVLAHLELARDAAVVVDDGDGMAFRHAVIRSALLDQMSTTRRRRLHHDIAVALERACGSSIERHLPAVAHHHDRAGTAEAPRWYQRAATTAAASLDVTAVDLADRGLELLATDERPDEGSRCDLLISRAVGLPLTGEETTADARCAADAAIALGDPERVAVDAQVRQRQVMRQLLDGRWSGAGVEIAAVRAGAAQDANLLLGCEAQASWLRRERGEAEGYRTTCALAAARPTISLVQAVLASDAAEAGHDDVARAQLDRLGDEGYAGAGREWMTVMALRHLAWAATTVDVPDHTPGLRARRAPYGGQLAVLGTGTYVLGAVDRLFRALAQERSAHAPPLEARTLHWWGRALRRRGDPARAGPLLADARSIAARLGLVGLVRQVDALGTHR